MRSALTMAVALALVSRAGAARAQGDGASERRRREMIEQAAAASRGGDHRAAIDLMTRAGAVRMTPALRMVMAQEQRLLGRAADAFDSATRCQQELRATADVENRAQVGAECESLVNALRSQVGRLRVIAPTPTPPGFRASVGGRDVGAPASDAVWTVAAGPVAVAASAADGTHYEETLRVPGGGEQTVTIALGRGPVASTARPEAPAPDAAPGEVTQVSVGGWNVCVRRAGGRVLCWGSSVGGASGFTPVAGLDRATSVSVGPSHACAVVAGGTVRCWGEVPLADASGAGQGAEGRRVPREVPGLAGAVSVSAGTNFTCALLESGAVRCWGENGAGQLGDGTTASRALPADVAGLGPAAQVVASNALACARLRDGSVACWGNSRYGQAGAAGDDPVTRPARIAGLSGVVQIALGYTHALAVRDDGSVWWWGERALGHVVYPGDASGPEAVAGLRDVAEVATGNWHACARLRSRAVVCWGDNEHGELGAGRLARSPRPRRVAPLGGALAVAASVFTTCALRVDGDVRCWGEVPSTQPGESRRAASPTSLPLDARARP